MLYSESRSVVDYGERSECDGRVLELTGEYKEKGRARRSIMLEQRRQPIYQDRSPPEDESHQTTLEFAEDELPARDRPSFVDCVSSLEPSPSDPALFLPPPREVGRPIRL